MNEALLRSLTPSVLGILVRRGANFAAAEDAVQDALVEAIRVWPADPPRDPKGWLVTVAWRRFLDVTRADAARRRREDLIEEEPAPGPAPAVDDTLQLYFPWLLAAGYAPRYPETPLTGPALSRVRTSLQALLDAHDPFPGVAIDRQWNVQLSNHAARRLVAGISEDVRGVPTNLFRTALHPAGLAGRTRNFPQWSAHLLRRLDRAVVRTRDPRLATLADEIATWPAIPERHTWNHLFSDEADDPVLSWRPELDGEELSMFSILSTFGTPMDVALSDLSIELFFPADEQTETILRHHA